MRKTLFLLVLGIIFIPIFSIHAAEDFNNSESNIAAVNVSLADTEEDLISAGITPDSAFYFLDTAWEGIGNFFTFGSKAKERRAIRIAAERLAEAEAMAEIGEAAALEVAISGYDKALTRAERYLGRLIDDPEAEGIIAQATGVHQSVLERVLAKAPESAREGLENAIAQSDKRHRDHLRILAELDEGKAAEISARVEERRLVHIRDFAADRELDPQYLERALQSYDRYRDFVEDLEEGRGEFRASLAEHLGEVYDTIYDLEALSIEHLTPELRREIRDRAESFVEEHREKIEDLVDIDIERATRIHGEILERVTHELEARPELEVELRERIVRDIETFGEVGDHILERAELLEDEALRERVLQRVGETAEAHIEVLRRVIEFTPEEAREIINNLIEGSELTREELLRKMEIIRMEELERSFIEGTKEELLQRLETTEMPELTEEEKLRILEQLSGTSELRLDTTEEQSLLDRIREEIMITEEGTVEPTIVDTIIEPVMFDTVEELLLDEAPAVMPVDEVIMLEPQVRHFTIYANDSGAEISAPLRARPGDTVVLTFHVRKAGTYFGGLQFKSRLFDTGRIAPGDSKIVEFVVDGPITFIAYWPNSGTRKWDRTIAVYDF